METIQTETKRGNKAIIVGQIFTEGKCFEKCRHCECM